MKVINLEQGSKDWLEWRKTGIGSSDACDIHGTAPWNDPDKLRRIKMGREVVKVNEAMLRGSRLEPEARRLFILLTGIDVVPCCCIHDTYDFLKASLDGITSDHKTIVEIKSPVNIEKHQKFSTQESQYGTISRRFNISCWSAVQKDVSSYHTFQIIQRNRKYWQSAKSNQIRAILIDCYKQS